MPERPELPINFRHRTGAFDVLPDEEPMTWTVWDDDGWVGVLRLDGDRWRSQARGGDAEFGPYAGSTEAIGAMLDGRVT